MNTPFESPRSSFPVGRNPFAVGEWVLAVSKVPNGWRVAEIESGLKRATLRRYAWLARWPLDLQSIVLNHPTIFKIRVLIAGFASRQRFYEKDSWKNLRHEIEKQTLRGSSLPLRRAHNYPKKRSGGSLNAQRERRLLLRKRLFHGPSSPNAETTTLAEQLHAQDLLREALCTWVKVDSEEIRISYCGREDLERLLNAMQRMLRS